MDRRGFLALAATGALSGCLGIPGTGRNDHRASGFPVELRDLDVSTEKLYPTHPIHFTNLSFIYELDTDDPQAKDPIEYEELSPEIKESVRRIIEENPPTGFDNPPDELLEIADRHLISCPGWCDPTHEYVELYYEHADPTTPPVAELTAELTTNATEIQLTLSNPREDSITVSSGPPPPFSVVHAVGIDGTDNTISLWSDAYDDTDYVRLSDGGLAQNPVGTRYEVEGNTAVTRRYGLDSRIPDPFTPGTYTLSGKRDGSMSLWGEKIDEPLLVSYRHPAQPAGEIIAVRVTMDLIAR